MRRAAAILSLLAVPAGGCNQAEGTAVITCATTDGAAWPGCPDLEPKFTFDADFFALVDNGDFLDLRLQRSGRGPDVAEGFQIQLFQPHTFRGRDNCLGRAVPLEVPDLARVSPDRFPACLEQPEAQCRSTSVCPRIRMTAHFPRTCEAGAAPLVAGDPAGTLPNEVTSKLSFVVVGTRPGDKVSGEFDVRISDGRTAEEVGRCATDEEGFRFVVKEGQPYVRFVD